MLYRTFPDVGTTDVLLMEFLVIAITLVIACTAYLGSASMHAGKSEAKKKKTVLDKYRFCKPSYSP